MTLATSSQPCCQCYGATFWAGIDHLLIRTDEPFAHALRHLFRSRASVGRGAR